MSLLSNLATLLNKAVHPAEQALAAAVGAFLSPTTFALLKREIIVAETDYISKFIAKADRNSRVLSWLTSKAPHMPIDLAQWVIDGLVALLNGKFSAPAGAVAPAPVAVNTASPFAAVESPVSPTQVTAKSLTTPQLPLQELEDPRVVAPEESPPK